MKRPQAGTGLGVCQAGVPDRKSLLQPPESFIGVAAYGIDLG